MGRVLFSSSLSSCGPGKTTKTKTGPQMKKEENKDRRLSFPLSSLFGMDGRLLAPVIMKRNGHPMPRREREEERTCLPA